MSAPMFATHPNTAKHLANVFAGAGEQGNVFAKVFAGDRRASRPGAAYLSRSILSARSMASSAT